MVVLNKLHLECLHIDHDGNHDTDPDLDPNPDPE